MAKLRLTQKTAQKLSPQQLQIIGLLQVSSYDLEKRINDELTDNPLLERVEEQEDDIPLPTDSLEYVERSRYQDLASRKNNRPTPEGYAYFADQQIATPTLQEEMMEKLQFLTLDEEEKLIARHILGSLTDGGYLKKKVLIIVEEIALSHYKEVSPKKVAQVLKTIQELGPPGIAARNLQECLSLQLAQKKQTPIIKQATQIIQEHFQELTKKQYERIATKMGIPLQDLKPPIDTISTLQAEPAPVASGPTKASERLHPDFDVAIINDQIQVTLIKKTPELKIRRHYQDLLTQDNNSTPTDAQALNNFIKDKINRATWFIQALKKREKTLFKIMRAIVHRQEDFFRTGSSETLKPLFLRHIAEDVSMDISTISRAVTNKAVHTYGQTYPLRFFFSEAIATTDGKAISSSVIKLNIQHLVDQEDKKAPMTDEMITEILKKRGYKLARRTITKYRQLLNIPTSQMRRNPLAP